MNATTKVRSYRLLIFITMVLLMGVQAVVPARAAETRGGQDVVITANDVINDNLYVAANTVTIDGTVKGDLTAVAQRITISGTVQGDVLAAAQAIVVYGTVGGDMRSAGQAIMLGPRARVGGDLAIGAASLENQAGSTVGGDLLIGAYQALLAGNIGRDVRGGLNRLAIQGSVGRNVDVTIASEEGTTNPMMYGPSGVIITPAVPLNLTIADTARIGGQLTYRAYTSATIDPHATVSGGVTPTITPVAQPTRSPIAPVLAVLRRFASLVLIGLLLVWFAPSWTRRMADLVEDKPLSSLGWGVVSVAALALAMLVIVIVTVLLAIGFGFLTLGGLVAFSIGVGVLINTTLAIGALAYMGYGAVIIISYLAGRWILGKVRTTGTEEVITPMIVGVVLYVALTAVPVLGVMISMLVVLLGLGALWEWASALIQGARPTARPIIGIQPA
ncbi:MAG TPA: polymer-forming cytoskeletal protein [Roseiflexaceae bacterium]|nr:polymer-forming cytoskeletal protein [Roseiflexaceae bacterium]